MRFGLGRDGENFADVAVHGLPVLLARLRGALAFGKRDLPALRGVARGYLWTLSIRALAKGGLILIIHALVKTPHFDQFSTISIIFCKIDSTHFS